MGKDSAIQWTDHTFNPWRGCTKVSAGCAICYAETLSRRNPATLGIWGPNGTRVVASEAMWRNPYGWNAAAIAQGERHRVFCASLADVFERWDGYVQDSAGRVVSQRANGSFFPIKGEGPNAIGLGAIRKRLFRLILATPHLDWLLLTKRPEDIMNLWPVGPDFTGPGKVEWPNLWLGTSVEDRKCKQRIDRLREVEAAVRFLSVEPLIEDLGELDLRGIDWVIVGGESGHNARPFDLAWARSIRDQCQAAGVAFFMKQLGSKANDSDLILDRQGRPLPKNVFYRLKTNDSHGGDWDEWPADLKVREFPTMEAISP